MADRRTRVRRHEEGTQTGDDPIGGVQVRRTLAATIEDLQLMPDQHGFGNNRTDAARPCQSGHSDDQMNDEDQEVAHPGNGISTSKTTGFQANLAIRHGQVCATEILTVRLR